VYYLTKTVEWKGTATIDFNNFKVTEFLEWQSSDFARSKMFALKTYKYEYCLWNPSDRIYQKSNLLNNFLVMAITTEHEVEANQHDVC